MNRQQLKTLINEAIKEVLNEKTPPGFDPELKKQILKQYPGEADKAYATMQKIHKDTAGKKKKSQRKYLFFLLRLLNSLTKASVERFD